MSRSASSVATTSARNFALARYNPNGSLDATFSGDGNQANGVAIQADGKIVAAGSGLGTDVSSTNSDFALARYRGLT